MSMYNCFCRFQNKSRICLYLDNVVGRFYNMFAHNPLYNQCDTLHCNSLYMHYCNSLTIVQTLSKTGRKPIPRSVVFWRPY